jgi:hypothetical protein
MNVHDYLIDHNGFDWAWLLSGWEWLLPPEFSVWLMNCFGDLFLILPDGRIQMLDVCGGSLTKLAESRDEFARVLNEAPRPEAEVSGRPPRGGRFRAVAPVGGVDINRTEASPDRSAGATPTSLSQGRRQEEHPEKARRIARSSSGHTARGRGFMK